MSDCGHDLIFGTFITRRASGRRTWSGLPSSPSGSAGPRHLHGPPLPAGFLDTWTLLSYLAAAT